MEYQRERQYAGFRLFSAQPKLDWGPSATDVAKQPRSTQAGTCPSDQSAASSTRDLAAGLCCQRLDRERHLRRSDRLPVLAATRLQPAWKRRLAQSRPAQLEPFVHGNLYPHTAIRILRSQRLHPAHGQCAECSGGNTVYGAYGNVKRDSLIGPGLSELDFWRSRIPHHERLDLQFRAEFFNILNHTISSRRTRSCIRRRQPSPCLAESKP